MSLALGRHWSSLLIKRHVTFDPCPRQSLTLFRSVLCRRRASTITPSDAHMTSARASQPTELPRLPVPSVAETSRKFLRTVAPLLNNEEFHETKKMVAEFERQSEPLQDLLIKRAETEENWLSQWWLDKVYLEWRLNLPIIYNPALLFPRQSYRDFDGQIQFAAQFIHGALRYRSLIDNDQLPSDKFGSDLLCMDQYKKLFGTCRIPAPTADRLHVYNKAGHRHVAVFYRNNVYRLPVYDERGEKLSAESIYSHLKKLEALKEASNEKAPLIGHLTADERQLWAPIYSQLSSIPENKDLFDTIHDSLLVLCLDESYRSFDRTDAKRMDTQTIAGLNFLHGGGTSSNTANRWFDKTLQVILGPDGYCGLNYEHSVAEGGMVTALVDYALSYCKTAAALTSVSESSSLLNKCQVVIPKEVEQSIAESRQRVDKFVENCDLTLCKYSEYGKQFAKENKLSIDGIIQVALQLAYYRVHGKSGATYESGSLRRYHLGRTETIRSCTVEAQTFARAMSEQHNETSPDSKYELFSKAMQAQRQNTNDAINAKGIDRHLLGLKLIALENHLTRPALYDHVSYKRAMHFILSTSQVAAKHDCVMIYGAAVDDGYGCCYNPRQDSINYMITAFRANNAGSNAAELSNQLNRSLTDIRRLVEDNAKRTMKAKL